MTITTTNAIVPTRSVGTAYFLWLSLFFGAHRFYVGKWLTALAYPVSILVFLPFVSVLTPDQLSYFALGYLGFLVMDACFIPRWVRQKNEWFAEDFKIHPNRYLIPDSEDIAPWARGQAKKSDAGWYRSSIRFYFFFWIVPLFTGIWAAELQSLEVLIIPIVVLVAIGLINTLDQMLENQPAILEIPGVGPALERVAEMRAHFWNNEPKISRSVWGLFSNWKAYKPYWTLAMVVAATVVIEGVISFGDNTKFIETNESVMIIGGAALLAAFIVLANLIPITTLSFHYSLSGKRIRLRFMTVGALVATITGYNIQPFLATDEAVVGKIPSYISQQRLENRMKDANFKKELKDKMDMFLWYYINKGMSKEKMNEHFRSLLKGIAPNDEADAFEIIERDEWAAVLYYHSGAQCSLIDEEVVLGEVVAVDQIVETDPSIETDSSVDPKYSIIAVVVKNTDEEKINALNDLPDDLKFEDFDTLEDFKKLEVINHVIYRMISYKWGEFLNYYVTQPECQSTLLCDDTFGGCPWMEEELP